MQFFNGIKIGKLYGFMLVLLAVSGFFVACQSDMLDAESNTDKPGQRAKMVFSFSGPLSRSALIADESAVSSLHVLAYRDGLLVGKVSCRNYSDLSMELEMGVEYNLYALANCELPRSVNREDDFVAYGLQVNDLTELGGSVPMAWKSLATGFFRPGQIVHVSLERLLARLELSLDSGLLKGLEVKSLRLMQCASKIYPFREGYKITQSDVCIDGDYASASDLEALNSGKTLVLYCPENCQGNLLPGNRDPWEKSAENLSNAGQCTFMEMGCEFTGNQIMSGTVSYRLYPGENNCDNFNLKRNHTYRLALCLSPDGLNKLSWKVDSDVSYGDAIVNVWVDKAMHTPDNLYPGEVIRLGFEMNPDFREFIQTEFERGGLCVSSINGSLSQYGAVTVDEDGFYYVAVECLDKFVTDQLCLLDSRGERICKLIDTRINKAQIVFGSCDKTSSKCTPYSNSGQGFYTAVINSPDTLHIDAYLCDSKGYNLNSGKNLAFVSSCYDNMTFRIGAGELLNESKATVDKMSACWIARQRKTDMALNGPLYNLDYVLRNPGNDLEVCRVFSSLYRVSAPVGRNSCFRIDAEHKNVSSLSQDLDFDIIMPHLLLTDESMYSLTNTGMNLLLCISNPSEVELRVRACTYGVYAGTDNQFTSCPPEFPAGIYDYESTVTADKGILKSQKYSWTERLWINKASPHIKPLYGVASSQELMKDCPVVGNSTLNGEKCRVYRLGDVQNGYYVISNAWNWSARSVYVGSDLDITTLSNAELQYHAESALQSRYDSSKDLQANFWSAGKKLIGNGLGADKYNNIAYSHSDYSCNSLVKVADGENPVRFNLYVDAEGLKLEVSNNISQLAFNVELSFDYMGICSWRKNSNSDIVNQEMHFRSSSTSTVFLEEDNKIKNFMTAATTSSVMTLHSREEIIMDLRYFNQNYWHNSCTNAIPTQKNRFSKFVIPQNATFKVKIKSGRSDWIPVELKIKDSLFSIVSTDGVFYNRTERGSYKDSAKTNPDGSSRDCDNISGYGMINAEKYNMTGVQSTISIVNSFDRFYDARYQP